ncbi:MAG: LrgB family protein [Pontibacterium sp.]
MINDVLTELPLIWVVLTSGFFLAAVWLSQKAKGSPLLQPVMVSSLVVIIVLVITDTPYVEYADATSIFSYFLGPAIVALAVPLYENLGKVKSLLNVLLLSSLMGGVIAPLSAMTIAYVMGVELPVILTLATKSVTTPIALSVAEEVGGYPSLAAVLVLLTGAIGCIMAPVVFKMMGVDDEPTKGYSLGVVSHGFGTAYAFQYGAAAGAFAGLGMGITGALSAFFLPLLTMLFT